MTATKDVKRTAPLDFNEADKPPLHRRLIAGVADLFDREKRERDEQRKADQKAYRELPKLLTLREQLTIEHKAIEVEVERGNKTDRASFHSNQKLFDVSRQINRLTGEVFDRLVQSCSDPVMQRRHKELRDGKRPQCEQIQKLRTELNDRGQERTQLEQNRAVFLEGLEKQGLKTPPASAVFDLQRFDRRIAELSSWIAECQVKLDAALVEQQADIKEMDELRKKMAEA